MKTSLYHSALILMAFVAVLASGRTFAQTLLLSDVTSSPSNLRVQEHSNLPDAYESHSASGFAVNNKDQYLDFQKMLQQGEAKAVVAILEKTEPQQRSWNTYFWLGTAYLLENRLNKAAHALDIALSLQSDIAELWVQRATVEHERGNLIAAVHFLKVSLQVEPKNAKAYLNLAYAFDALKQPKQARAAYGYYLKLADGKNIQDIRLKQKILANMLK